MHLRNSKIRGHRPSWTSDASQSTKDPRVSVIMPAYNGAAFIRKSIDSVLKQSFNDFELIIVNDGSTDSTRRIIKTYSDPRIILIENRHNLGVSKARNIGLKHAKGEYIAYCDHDDVYHKNHLKCMAQTLDADPNIGLVYANFSLITPRQKNRLIRSKFNKARLETDNIIGPPMNVMHRAVCLKKVGMFDESKVISKHSVEDQDLWLRISDYFVIRHIDLILSKFIFHKNNRSFNVNFQLAYMYVLKKRLKRIKSKDQLVRYVKAHCLKIVINLLGSKCFEQAYDISRKFANITTSYQTYACPGLCNLAEGHFQDAITFFRKSLKIMRAHFDTSSKKDAVLIKTAMAKAYFYAGQFPPAVNLCHQALRLDKKNIDVRQILARIHIKKGQHRKAIALLRRMGDCDSLNIRAYCYFADGKYRKASNTYLSAIRKDPKFYSGHHNLAIAYMRLGQFSKARCSFKRALELRPNNTLSQKMLLRASLKKQNLPLSPKVSVIMSTYNRAHMIKKAVRSVLNQSFRNFELIIINDGSTDDTKSVIRGFKNSRIVYIEKKHGGLSSGLNTGLRYALGNYIAYLDDDDIYYPNHLKKLTDFLDSHRGTGLVYSAAMLADHRGRLLVKRRFAFAFNKKRLEINSFIPTCSVMHRMKCLEETGPYDEKMTIGMDWDMWLKISDSYKITFLPVITAGFSKHDKNITLKTPSKIFYAAVIQKRVLKARKEGRLLEYIDQCSIRIIKILTESKETTTYAFRLANEFHSITISYQTLACLGICHLAKGNFHIALDLFQRSLKAIPRCLPKTDSRLRRDKKFIMVFLARTYDHLNKTDMALSLCEKILKLTPGDLETKIQLATCYIKKGFYPKALRLLRKNTYEPQTHNLRGYCFFKKNEFKHAAQEFEKSVLLGSALPMYRHNLATACAASKNVKMVLNNHLS